MVKPDHAAVTYRNALRRQPEYAINADYEHRQIRTPTAPLDSVQGRAQLGSYCGIHWHQPAMGAVLPGGKNR